MTHGYGEPPSGWPPPSDPGPRPPGRRRAPDPDDQPPPGYEDRTFHAPAPPPVAEAPYRPRQVDPGSAENAPYRPRQVDPGSAEDANAPNRPRRGEVGAGGLTDRYVPRRPGGEPPRPYPEPAGGGQDPGRWDGWHPGGAGPPVPSRPPVPSHPSVPSQWNAAPAAAPGPDLLDLPDRRRRTTDPRTRRATPDRRHTSPWLTAVGVLAVAVLVGVCAAGGYIMFNHGDAGGATANGSPAAPLQPRDITTRQADPAPLTEAEIFPAPAVAPTGGSASTGAAPSYLVVKTQAIPDCKVVAVGDPGKVLAAAGCTQGVRATLVSADKTFVMTAGLLNLESQIGAQQANDQLRPAVGAQKGRFTGLDVGGASDVFTRAATQLGWDVRGHFLAYCVVARVDGKPLDGTDPAAGRVIDDLVEKYLIGTVIQARVAPPSPAPAPTKPPAANTSKK